MTQSKETGQLVDAELLRYARQILLDGWDIDAQLRLKASRVVMIVQAVLVARLLKRSCERDWGKCI